ncbi:MAG: hypothetical protein HY314_15870 [Acidobacteria bacterium]|nr:hypothetical protein [Acidobacteriota bacterium]
MHATYSLNRVFALRPGFPQSLGKNTLRFKVTAFAVSAALAVPAGSLYAHHITYIDPTSFTVMESILVISMVIIGGDFRDSWIVDRDS